MSHFDKSYTNGEITVFWKPEICQHSGNCARGLPTVFKPRQHPWITLEEASTAEIIVAVENCPSRALTWKPVEIDPRTSA
ncbi:MAG: (4Fe-4S)-binding protein [Bacteroidetes bacterium]|nr:(4Fe-4S)-binding protein [Bacteroidota bacterium]